MTDDALTPRELALLLRRFGSDKNEARRRRELDPDAEEAYQFTRTGSFGDRALFRIIRRGEHVVLISHECHGYSIDRDPVEYVEYNAKLLSAEEWDFFQWKLHQANFWDLPWLGGDSGLDGDDWQIEGRRGDKYHVVERWSPYEEAFFELGALFVELADAVMPQR